MPKQVPLTDLEDFSHAVIQCLEHIEGLQRWSHGLPDAHDSPDSTLDLEGLRQAYQQSMETHSPHREALKATTLPESYHDKVLDLAQTVLDAAAQMVYPTGLLFSSPDMSTGRWRTGIPGLLGLGRNGYPLLQTVLKSTLPKKLKIDHIRRMLEKERLLGAGKVTDQQPRKHGNPDKVGKKPPIKVGEANKIALRLAKKDPSFVRGTVRDWQHAISAESGTTCSVSTVQKTQFWKTAMTRTDRGRTKGRQAKAIEFSGKLEATTGIGTRDEVLNQLAAAEDEKSEAIQAIKKSGLNATQQEAMLENLQQEEMTAAEAKEVAEAYFPPPRKATHRKPFRSV